MSGRVANMQMGRPATLVDFGRTSCRIPCSLLMLCAFVSILSTPQSLRLILLQSCCIQNKGSHEHQAESQAVAYPPFFSEGHPCVAGGGGNRKGVGERTFNKI